MGYGTYLKVFTGNGGTVRNVLWALGLYPVMVSREASVVDQKAQGLQHPSLTTGDMNEVCGFHGRHCLAARL